MSISPTTASNSSTSHELELSLRQDFINRLRTREFDKARRIADSFLDAAEGQFLLRDASKALVEENRFDEALEMVHSMSDRLSVKQKALRDISKALAKRGWFERALNVAYSIPKNGERERALKTIHRCLVRAGKAD